MFYKLRKAPKRDLYWVVTIETGKKHSKEPIAFEKAQAQKRILEQALVGGVQHPMYIPKKPSRFYPTVEIEQGTRDILTLEDIEDDDFVAILNDNPNFVMLRTSYDRLLQPLIDRVGQKEAFLTLTNPFLQGEVINRMYFANARIIRPQPRARRPSRVGFEPQQVRRAKGKGSYAKGKASVFVITCIDPRYNYDVTHFLEKQKQLHKDYDLFVLAGASVGATKWSKAFFDNLALGIKLHGIKEVWCFDHLDCGMYKATFKLKKDDKPGIHIQCMDKLKKMIAKKHPSLGFRKFLVSAKGSVRMVK